MTVSSETCGPTSLRWTGVETSFSPGWAASSTGSVQVYYLADAVGSIKSRLTEGLHYSVVLQDGSGLVTVSPIALPPSPGTLTFLRQTPAIQATNFSNLGSFAPLLHTELHDASAMRDAEIRRDLTNAIAGNIGTAVTAARIANDSHVAGGSVADALDQLHTEAGMVYAADYGMAAAAATDVGPALLAADAAAIALGDAVIQLPAGNFKIATPLYRNTWGAPGPLTVPGLKLRGPSRGVTTIDSNISGHAIQINPEFRRAVAALKGIATSAGGNLANATTWVQITVSDALGNEIVHGSAAQSLAVGANGKISVILPTLNPGWSYNLYADTANPPAHRAVVNGADAIHLAGGATVNITAIGTLHAVPSDKLAIWQEVLIEGITFINSTNAANASAVLLFKCGYSNVVNNVFDGFTKDGITLPNYFGDSDGSFKPEISGNRFNRIGGIAVNAAGAALELSSIVIRKNAFNLCGTPTAGVGTTINVASIGNSVAPAIGTTTAHGLLANDMFWWAAASGISLAAGWYQAGTINSPTSFQLLDLDGVPVNTTAMGAWTSGGTVALGWRPPVWDPVALETRGSGAIAVLGLEGEIDGNDFTQCYNWDIYASEFGSSDSMDFGINDHENCAGIAVYLASLSGGNMRLGEILSTAAFGATIVGVKLGTGFNAGGVKNFTIDPPPKFRSDVTTMIGYLQVANTNLGAAFADSVRVHGLTDWQNFVGVARFQGFKFDPAPGLCTGSISALDTARIAPTGYGSTMPVKLDKTGEWVAAHVPQAGISRVVGPQLPNTQYYIYYYNAADPSSPIALAIEVPTTTAPAISAEGYAVLPSDHTRAYFMTATTDGSGHFQTNGNQSSWYPPNGLAVHAVTRAMLSQGAALSVIGNAGNATADEADIAAAANETFLLRRGNALSFSTIDLSQSAAFNSTILGAANGGLGAASLSAHGLVIAEGASAAVSLAGGSGKVLQGQSGADPLFTSVPLLGTAGAQAGGVQFANLTSGLITVSPPTGALGSVTSTLQAAADTFVYRATVDTLTNKTISGASNTLTVRWGNDVSGLGSGVATAGAINVGTSGALMVLNGALGSPSSIGTLPAYTLGGQISGAGNNVDNVVIGSGTPLAGTFTTLKGNTSTTTPQVLGGTAAGSSLTLQSTSGVGSGDSVLIKTGNNGSLSTLRATQTGVGINTAGNPLVDLQVGGAGGSNAGFEVIAGATVNFQFFNRNSSAYAPAIIAGSQLTFQAGAPATVLQLTSGTAAITGALQTKQGSVAVANGLNSNIATPSASWVRLTGPTAAFSIGGFTGGADGQELVVYNTTAQTMTIVNEDASSTAGNRIKTLSGGNVVLRATATSSATFRYDATDSRWILISSN